MTTHDTLQGIQMAVWDAAHANGWHDYYSTLLDQKGSGRATQIAHWIAAQCALIHTEVAEATQAIRTPHDDGTLDIDSIGDELADIIMRTLDLAESLGINTTHHIHQKLATNDDRGYHHGGKLL